MVSNLRKLHGVGALVELRARIAPEVSAGAEIGLLTAALTGSDAAGGTDVRLTQVPIYGVVRFLHGFTPRLWAGLGAQLGVTVARADFSTTGQPDQRRSAVGLSAGGGGTLELTLGPGRAVLDVRWVTGVVDVDLEGELLGLEAGAGYTVGF